MTETRVAIRDAAVTFQVSVAGDGPPLVYFHGIHDRGGRSEFLDRLARHFRVFAPLHPGVGESTGVETLDDLLDLTLAYDELFDALGLERAHLVGHFFGAMMAAEVAAVAPRRASRLALISPLGLWREEAPSADVLILPPDDLAAALWRDPRSEPARRWAALPENDAENVAAQLESIQRRAAMGKFVWPIPDKGITRRLHRIAAPTLVLWGDADRANPVVYAEEWHRRIKGAGLHVLAGGHMLHHEAPEACAAAVERFLQ